MSLAIFIKQWKITKIFVVVQLDIACPSSYDISNLLAQEKSISKGLNKSLDCQSFERRRHVWIGFFNSDRNTIFFHVIMREGVMLIVFIGFWLVILFLMILIWFYSILNLYKDLMLKNHLLWLRIKFVPWFLIIYLILLASLIMICWLKPLIIWKLSLLFLLLYG